jgi:hypothetical protein
LERGTTDITVFIPMCKLWRFPYVDCRIIWRNLKFSV